MGLTAVEAVMTSLVIGAWLMVALALSRGDFKEQVAPHTDVWVRQIRPDTFASSGEVFSVPMAMNDAFNVEHLRAAICARTQRHVFAVFRHQESSPIEPADTRVEANSADTPYRFIVAEFWVKFGNSTFEVTPLKNNIDSLKDAVKAKMHLQQPAPTLVVKDNDGKVLKASSPLTANTEETAYVVE